MPKPREHEVWRAIVSQVGAEPDEVDEADEAEIDRAASVSVADAEKELAAAGFDVAAERAKAEAFVDALEGKTDEAQAQASGKDADAPVAATAADEPATAFGAMAGDDGATARVADRRRRPVVLWLAAAATLSVAGGVMVAALQEGPRPGPLPPTKPSATAPETSSVPATAIAKATELRRRAHAECNAHRWEGCVADLDEARQLDPDGDQSPSVQSDRDRANAGLEQKRPRVP